MPCSIPYIGINVTGLSDERTPSVSNKQNENSGEGTGFRKGLDVVSRHGFSRANTADKKGATSVAEELLAHPA